MDGLAEQLATSFTVSSDPNSTAAPHPRFSEYKRKASSSDQEGRRKNILELQKKVSMEIPEDVDHTESKIVSVEMPEGDTVGLFRRLDYANLARRLVEDVWEDASPEDFDDDDGEQEAMEATEAPAKKRYRPGRYYKNQLMLSEWLVEVPADFEEDWLMVTCPWGKRCLIVSSHGTTTAYGRNGYRVNSFPSHLPGGNRRQKNYYTNNAIMDCIYHEVEKTFYVLDIMNWKDHPVYDSETDFRFFWMISKLQEIPEVGEASKLNPYKFVPLQYHQCKKDKLKEIFESIEEQFDGCLFYHKRAHYTFGTSPLVVWLKPYMISEMLDMEVPERMMSQKPANYSSYAAHLQHVKETKEKIAADREKRAADRKAKRGPDRSREFKMELMESKWFTEIPENFETDWCVVVCPVGQRCLVMAIDGETKWFNKKGFKLPGYFLSVLPGGNGYEYGYGPTVVTMLDCVYYEDLKTFFILDCMMWAGHDLKEYNYEERAKLMRREILRNPEFKFITDLNQHRFVPLYQFDCTVKGIDQSLRLTTFDIDGLLFFKNECKYVSEVSVDTLWIKPYVLPDLFEDIAVPKKLMEEKPESYVNFEGFVDDVNSGRIKEKKKKKKKKAFVPEVILDLPQQHVGKADMENSQRRGKKEKKVAQRTYLGPGLGFTGGRRGYGRGGQGQGRGGHTMNQAGDDGTMGGYQDRRQNNNYSRIVSSAGGDNYGRRPYGKGTASGYAYYGDDRDMYYPKPQGRGGRKIRGAPDPFVMSDMEAALAYYDYDNGRRTRAQKNYKLF